MMMEMFGGVFVMMLFAYSLVPLFPFVYVLLRWRQAREGGAPDPQLGLKVAVYYFMTIGLHVVLMALALGLYGLIVDRAPESMMRAAAGLLLGGGIVYGLHRAILSRVVDGEGPGRDSAHRPRSLFCGHERARGRATGRCAALLIERSA